MSAVSVADDRPVSGISFAEGKVVIAGALLLEAGSRVKRARERSASHVLGRVSVEVDSQAGRRVLF